MVNEVEVCLLSILLCVGLLGNLLAVAVIHQNPRLQNLHNALVINLVSIDLLVLIFCIFPVITSYATNQWNLGEAFCHFSGFFLVAMTIVSIWNIVALSIYRYLLLRKPNLYAHCVTKKFILRLLILIWAISFVSSGLVYAVGTFRYFPKFNACFASFGKVTSNIVVLSILVFIPTLFLVCLTVIVSVTVLSGKHKAKHQRLSSVGTNYASCPQENKAANTYLILVVLLGLCWGPLLAIHIINQMKPELLNHSLYKFANFAGFLPFVLKPVIYVATTSEFRQGVTKIFNRLFFLKSPSIRPSDTIMSRKSPVIRIQRAWQTAMLESKALHYAKNSTNAASAPSKTGPPSNNDMI